MEGIESLQHIFFGSWMAFMISFKLWYALGAFILFIVFGLYTKKSNKKGVKE